MASIFARIDRTAAGTMAAVHGDQWTHKPMLAGEDVNAPAAADPGRPVQIIAAIYKEPIANPFIPNGFDPRSSQRPGVASGHPEIEIDPRWAPAGIEVKNPDLLVNVDSGKVWRVMKTRDDEMGRIFAAVNLVG